LPGEFYCFLAFVCSSTDLAAANMLIKDHQQEINDLKQQHSFQLAQHKPLRQEIEDERLKVKNLTASLETLETQLASLRSHNSQLKAKIAYNQQKDDASDKVEQIRSLTTEIATLTQALNGAETQSTSLQVHNRSLLAKIQQLEQAQAKSASSTVMASEAKSLKSQVAMLTTKLTASTQTVSEQQQQIDDLRQQLLSQTVQVHSLTEQHQRLKQALLTQEQQQKQPPPQQPQPQPVQQQTQPQPPLRLSPPQQQRQQLSSGNARVLPLRASDPPVLRQMIVSETGTVLGSVLNDRWHRMPSLDVSVSHPRKLKDLIFSPTVDKLKRMIRRLEPSLSSSSLSQNRHRSLASSSPRFVFLPILLNELVCFC
jgi:hypothetical protein